MSTEGMSEEDLRVGSAAFAAMESFCERMDGLIKRGLLTAADITDSLRPYPDFRDFWAEWDVEEQ